MVVDREVLYSRKRRQTTKVPAGQSQDRRRIRERWEVRRGNLYKSQAVQMVNHFRMVAKNRAAEVDEEGFVEILAPKRPKPQKKLGSRSIVVVRQHMHRTYGIVPYQQVGDRIFILLQVSYSRRLFDIKLDPMRGIREDKESTKHCAVRECQEESAQLLRYTPNHLHQPLVENLFFVRTLFSEDDVVVPRPKLQSKFAANQACLSAQQTDALETMGLYWMDIHESWSVARRSAQVKRIIKEMKKPVFAAQLAKQTPCVMSLAKDENGLQFFAPVTKDPSPSFNKSNDLSTTDQDMSQCFVEETIKQRRRHVLQFGLEVLEEMEEKLSLPAETILQCDTQEIRMLHNSQNDAELFKKNGESGYRSRCLSHAKGALYHLS